MQCENGRKWPVDGDMDGSGSSQYVAAMSSFPLEAQDRIILELFNEGRQRNLL
jgi:hypothetical protein